MKYNQKGQVLPFCMILICVLLWFLFSNFEIGFQNFKKIENQKKLDAFALNLSTQYARGYNALAALNDALNIAVHRAEIVAAAATANTYCAAELVPQCIRTEAKLAKILPVFYLHLHDLGERFAKDQDDIANWMVKVQCYTLKESNVVFDQFQLYPKYECGSSDLKSQLPFYRPNNNEYDEKLKAINKCKTLTFNSYNDFKARIESLKNQSDGTQTDIEAQYLSTQNQKLYKNPNNLRDATLLAFSIDQRENNQYVSYHFNSASLKNCYAFDDIFHKLTGKLPTVFRVPSPLVFKQEFFDEKNRIIMIASSKTNSPFNGSHGDILSDIPNRTWSLSEVKIDGTDFTEMEFKTSLHSVSLIDGLSDQLTKTFSFGRWPDLEDIKDDIHH